MENFSPQLIVALVTATITAAVALLSVYFTNLGQRKRDELQFIRDKERDKKEFLKKKLEELYILFSKWEADVGSIYLTFIPVVKGEMSEKEAWEITQKNQLSEQGSWQQLNMIVHLYFPDLIHHLEPVLLARTVASRFINSGQLSEENQGKFGAAQQSFDEASENFMKEIANVSKAL